MTGAERRSFDQVGLVVDDLDAAIAHWTRHFAVGPWTVFRNVVLVGQYRGGPTRVGMDVALSYQGDLQVELIQPTGTAASPYRDAEGRPLLGLHHVAHIVDDLEAVLAAARAAGLEPVFEAANLATRVAYLAAPGLHGLLYELICGPGLAEMARAGIVAARNWDGRTPATVIDLAVS